MTFETIETARLKLNRFSKEDFELFVTQMLTDSRVVEFFYSYKKLKDIDQIRQKATIDFWEHFEESRRDYGLEIWAARTHDNTFIGWSGLLHTDLSDKYDGPEFQFMLAGDAQGKGFATEFAQAVLIYAKEKMNISMVIATVDIPNRASIKALEKVGFEQECQIEAYGSTEMYLYRKMM